MMKIFKLLWNQNKQMEFYWSDIQLEFERSYIEGALLNARTIKDYLHLAETTQRNKQENVYRLAQIDELLYGPRVKLCQTNER